MIALVMLIAFALPTLAACDTDKVVEKIEVLDPKTEFILGENNTIDYDNLQLKVTYEDGTSDVKTVKQWGAECTTPADLSKEGTSTYIISYGGKEAAVTVTVKVADAEKSETVTVTYKYNNGDPDHTASITKGGKAALSNPTRDGYTFDGWFVKDGTASGDWGEIWNADNPVNDDLILYAKWTKNIVTYTVTFNDGQQTTQQSVTEGGFVSFPEVKRPDATLDGWYTQNGTETGEWGDKWEETTPVTDNLTLYAKWTQVEYSHIMFNYLDNKTPTSFADIVKGTSLGDKLPTPASRKGYTFDGWYTQNGTTSGVWGTQWTSETVADELEIQLFAKWTATEATVTFNYNYPDGVANQPANEAVTVTFGSTLEGKLPLGTDHAPAHYTFAGWFTDRTAGEEWQIGTAVEGDTVLYAHWTHNTVKVTFVFNDEATANKELTVFEGDSVGVQQWPAETIYAKHRFVGWFDTDSASGGTEYNAYKAIERNVTLYARWIERVTVTFDLNYDNAVGTPDPQTVDKDGKITLPTGITRESDGTNNYTFVGWFTQNGTSEEWGDQWQNEKPVTSDITLYAKWEANAIMISVTYHGNGGFFADKQDTKEEQIVINTVPQLPEVTREGYKFIGWYTDSSCESKYDNTALSADTELYAGWEQQIAVYFNWGILIQEGDEAGSYETELKYFDQGTTEIALLSQDDAHSRVGRNFIGWYDSQAGGNFVGEDGETVDLQLSDGQLVVYYYAQWQITYVTVTLDYNNGETERIDVEFGTDLDLSQYVPTAEHKSFAGWYTDQECSENNIVTELKSVTTDKTTLYAKWVDEITIVLVYGNDNQSVSFTIPSTASLMTQFFLAQLNNVLQGKKNVLLAGIKSNPTASFMATSIEKSLTKINEMATTWQTYDIGIYKKVSGYTGDIVVDLMTALTNLQDSNASVQANGVMALVAVLGELAGMKSVYDTVDNGGMGLTAPTAPQQQFVQWNSFASGQKAPWPVAGLANDKDTIHALGGYDMQPVPKETVWLYGAWKEIESVTKYNVTLHYNDGSDNKYETQVYSGTTLALPGPSRNGLKFVGWFTKDGTGGDWGSQWQEETPVTESIELWAKWEQVNSTYIVTLNNGVETKSFTVTSGSTLNEAAQTNAELKQFLDSAPVWMNGEVEYSLENDRVDGNISLVARVGGSLTGYVLSFSAPDFYLNYKQRSSTAGDNLGYFKKLNEAYEVGTVNKFIFRPVVRLRTTEGTVTDYNPTTNADVYVSNDGRDYNKLGDEEKANFVEISNNTYQFKEENDGKYVKLEISLAGSGYTIPGSVQNKVTVEFKLVKGGYNVYDQRGLSVMNDNQQAVWAPLWGVKAEIKEDPQSSNNEGYKYKVELTETNPVKLAADDQALYKYVGNVDWVILHNDLDLDPTQMPQDFFWQAGDPLYYSAYQSLAGWSNQQKLLVGSLKDGDNSGQSNLANYMPMYDRKPDTFQAFQVGFSVNMQKGFYSTHKVSVSGNYFSLTHILERGGRRLQNYVDWDSATRVNDPIPHWSVFQLMTNVNNGGKEEGSTNRGTLGNPFTVKNIAMKGSTPQKDYYDKGKTVYFAPAGIMLANAYASINFDNINANNFFTVIVGDNYGGETDTFKTAYNVTNSKLYDVYSNMIYTWRGNIIVNDSDFVGSGGPLFIMCDGLNTDNNVTGEAILAGTDQGGPSLTVSGNCRLEAYATGAESWYDANKATALVTMMRGSVEDQFNRDLHKTLRWVKDGEQMRAYQDSDKDKNQYINVIGVMICSPGNLINGLDNETLDVRGTSSFWGETNYAMHNNLVKSLRMLQNKDGTKFPLIAEMCSSSVQTEQMKDLFMMTDLKDILDIPNVATAETYKQAWQAAKSADYNNKVCIYLSAGSLSNSKFAPYFGVILDIGDYTPNP